MKENNNFKEKLKEKNIENICVVCGMIKDNGIIVNGELICKACERTILKARIKSKEYNRCVERVINIYR